MSDSESIVSPGTVLAERYRLTKEIGRGGFGMVYLARQLNMDRDVAIKILPPKFMAISDVVERFRREARLASRLRHPNTITVHDYGKQDNLLFIVMEFLEGEDLADVLMRRTTVPMDRILHIGRQVLKSLHEAHQHKIVHRDLKPENIFLTQVGGEEDYVKVLDFGIAKLAMPEVKAGEDRERRKLTMSGSTVGTPTYMSPEQAAGEEVDALTDLYALGIILYEMACGRPPFRDDNPIKVMRSHLFEEVPRFPEGPLRDSRFEWIIRKALAKEREERFNSAKEFLKALEVKPTAMFERADHGEHDEEPPTVELPDIELSADNLDSRDLAFERTAAYEVEGSDALSLRSTHQTDADLAAQNSSATESGESVPFDSIPQDRRRDKVPQGASNSGLTDGSGLTSRTGLNEPTTPPPGFKKNASTSSILTVLEPGPEEDVILLTNKKDEAGAPEDVEPIHDEPGLVEQFESEATPSEVVQTGPNQALRETGPNQALPSPPQRTKPRRGPTLQTSSQPSRAEVPPDDQSQRTTPRGSEWSWGEEKRRDMDAAKAPRRGTDELDSGERPLGRTGSQKAFFAVLFIVVAAAASVGYLHFGGHVDLLGLF